MTADGVPPPRFEDLSALLRDTFWRLDPVGVAFDAEHTWNEYHEIADSAARRAAAGESAEAIERAVIAEFREDWGLSQSEETARAVAESVELYRRRPAVTAAAETDIESAALRTDHLQELGSWILRARPDRVQSFELHRFEPVDPRGSAERLEVFAVSRHHRSVVITVVNGGIITVTTGDTSYREIDLDHDLVDVIDELTTELLRAFPVVTAPRVDLERLGERIRRELGFLELVHGEIPEALLPGLTIDAMAYGRRLGLLPVATAISGSLWRYERGIPLNPLEQRVAFALSEESLDVEQWLDEWDIAPARREYSERFWIAVTFHLLLLTWSPRRMNLNVVWEMERAWGASTVFSETIRQGNRRFRRRRDQWVHEHLQVDLAIEVESLVAEYLADQVGPFFD